ncbi:M15 family metallopeptidase [Noviherbaspirillum sp.]|uniref:M15 family metallopeptidase n=1 Tax=Noviherbaspirillum sp. TaxID=1926288 RepID=UPI002B48A968|nr:M15 family metallopeptidase [Noviherbaspirillum sp.]HJV82754.1 M15 family metallopeptidase [Noviherbaspirillum sp.]
MGATYFFVFLGAIYGAAIGFGGWYVAGNDRRRQWRLRLTEIRAALMGWLGARHQSVTFRRRQVRPLILRHADHVRNLLHRHRRALSLALVILCAPPILVQLLASSGGLEDYDDMPRASAPVIAGLLQGEQLVPPPPLPPELFVTREIAAERNELASANREWNAFDAEFRQRLLTVYQLMAKRGYQMALLEGYRSPERQTSLARLGPHVTNAGAYQSYHQYGLAADSAFYRDGRIVISERDPWAMEGYRLYGQYAESVGLVWGGRWQLMDFGHVELRKPKTMARR